MVISKVLDRDSTDGIETTPNEVYGVSTDGIETTPNEVYGVSTHPLQGHVYEDVNRPEPNMLIFFDYYSILQF